MTTTDDGPLRPVSPATGGHALVIRALPGLGDLLCMVPLLRALRAAGWSRLTWARLGHTRWFERVFAELVDDSVVLGSWPGIHEAGPGDPLDTVAALRAVSADLVLQAHGDGAPTAMLAAMTGGRAVSIARRGAWTAPGIDTVWCDPDEHEVERLLLLADRVGAARVGERPEWPGLRHVGSDRPVAVLHPGTSRTATRWDLEGYGRVGDELRRRGWRLVLTGTAAERPLTAALHQRLGEAGNGVHDLGGCTTVDELAVLLCQATIVVCGDTGVSHLAAAVGCPAAVVFRCTSSTRWLPRTPGHVAVEALGGSLQTQVDRVLDHAATLTADH